MSDLPRWDCLLTYQGAPLSHLASPDMVVLAKLPPEYAAATPSSIDWTAFELPLAKAVDAWVLFSREDNFRLASIASALRSYRGILIRGVIECDQNLLQAINDSYEAKIRLLTGSKSESNEHDLFDEIGRDALLRGASDIHITLFEDRTTVAYRIKGELKQIRELSIERGRSLVSSAYNTLAEKGSTKEGFNDRAYQDAVIERVYPEGLVRFRYSGLPIAPAGADITLRLIPIGITQNPKTLQQLGYSEDQCDMLERIFSRSSGMVLIAGTTGSGKSTTLSTVLTGMAKRHPGKKIRTIEEPVEYPIPGAFQTPVLRKEDASGKPAANPFMVALRQLMRADPDIIMIGEIRDFDTAQLAIQGVRSGHMLVSTIHADGAPICFDRLIGMGVDRNDLASVGLIAGLVYQKLVPMLCEDCKVSYADWIASDDYDEALDRRIRNVVDEDNLGALFFRNPAGCSSCNHDGIRGREVVAEILRPTPAIGAAVQRSDSRAIWKLWRSTIKHDKPDDMTGRTAFEHAIYKMKRGRVDPRAVEESFRFLDEPVFADDSSN